MFLKESTHDCLSPNVKDLEEVILKDCMYVMNKGEGSALCFFILKD